MMNSDLYARMKEHLYSKKPVLGADSPFSELLQNKRNGKRVKKVRSSTGDIWVETPRDRNSDFEPSLIPKRQRELTSGLDEQIIALYAQGNSIEDVRRLLIKMMGVEISAGKISQITDKVLPEIEAWKTRELEVFYPIIYLDAIHVLSKLEWSTRSVRIICSRK